MSAATPSPHEPSPTKTQPEIVSLRLKLYDFALPYCKDKKILDVMCGIGYGSAYLGRVARNVTGIEADPASLQHANLQYASSNVQFKEMDPSRLEFSDSSFDVVCSFDAIEHLPEIGACLAEAARVLKPDGTCFVSTPQMRKTLRKPKNPIRRIEFSRRDFEALLRTHFVGIQLFGQRQRYSFLQTIFRNFDLLNFFSDFMPAAIRSRPTGVFATNPNREPGLNEILITKENISKATDLVAVCTLPKKA